jgi:hypothetical protein
MHARFTATVALSTVTVAKLITDKGKGHTNTQPAALGSNDNTQVCYSMYVVTVKTV